MELIGKFLVRILLFGFIGLVVGGIICLYFAITNNPNTFITLLCLIGGPVIGIVISLFTLDALTEKHYEQCGE